MLVEDATAKGAKIVTGGRIPPGCDIGWFYEPTILTGATHEMAIMREECFGPVASICRVAVRISSRLFDATVVAPRTPRHSMRGTPRKKRGETCSLKWAVGSGQWAVFV